MFAAGYKAKRVSDRRGWLGVGISDIYSVSGCISTDFADFINFWRHNGFWLFDSPEIIEQLALEHEIDLSGTALFYYRVHEEQFNDEWAPFTPDASMATQVTEPREPVLEGSDVVSFYVETSPECSPLSLTSEIGVNQHCLLSSEKEARDLIVSGRLDDAEPGPYRIFAVYSVDTPWPPTGG